MENNQKPQVRDCIDIRAFDAPLPKGFKIERGEISHFPNQNDIILINTDRVLQRRQMRRITRDGR